ncbi:MAG: hypothetical protein AB7O37_00705 [Vicinamibacteria bacterium]
MATIRLFLAGNHLGLNRSGKSRPTFGHLGYLIRAQEVVMLFANFEAFVGDTVRTIARARPEVLKRAKRQVSWERVLASGSWEALMGHLVEQHVHNFDWKSLRKKFEAFDREYGLVVTVPEHEVETLEALAAIRNLVVHNDCRISPEYRIATKCHQAVGRPVPIGAQFVDKAALAIAVVGSDIFEAVATKFLGADSESVRTSRIHRPVANDSKRSRHLRMEISG